MKKIFIFIFIVICISLYFYPTYDEPWHNPDNWEVGRNGEPPKVHKENYKKQFTVLYSDYFSALNLFFNFINEEGFHIIQFGDCFNNARIQL